MLDRRAILAGEPDCKAAQGSKLQKKNGKKDFRLKPDMPKHFHGKWESLTQTRLCSRPWRKISLGRSIPMKTILLVRASPAAQAGPRSLPINWCTP